MYNMQHLSEALAILWDCPPARQLRQIHRSHEHGKYQGLTMMWPQGQLPAPGFAVGKKEIKRGGTGGYEYIVISTDPNSLVALCPALST